MRPNGKVSPHQAGTETMMSKNKQYYLWTKKLGPSHYFLPNQSETLCGISMLGNNYPAALETAIICADCQEIRDKQKEELS